MRGLEIEKETVKCNKINSSMRTERYMMQENHKDRHLILIGGVEL